MNFTGFEFVRYALDLFIMSFGLIVLVYALSRPRVREAVFPGTGRFFLITGTIAFVVAHWTQTIASSIPEELLVAKGLGFMSGGLPTWLFWTITRGSILFILIGLSMFIWLRKRLERAVKTTSDMMREAQDSIAQSEARFRHLLETTSNSIFCYVFDPPMPISLPIEEQIRRSHDALLTECNTVFAKTLNSDNASAVIGSRMGALDGTRDTEAHAAYFGEFIRNDYRLSDYELVYKTPAGEDGAVRSSLTGIVRDGMLHRFWGAETNILDLRQTEAALRRRRQYQELLGNISSRLVTAPVTVSDQAIKSCMLDLCRYTGADRTSLIWYDAGSSEIELAYSFTAEGEIFATPVSMATYPKTTEMLLENKPVVVNDTDNPPDDVVDDKHVFKNRGLRSFVALPLNIDGEVVGVSTYACTTSEKVWIEQEIADLQVFAELMASFIMRVRSRRALDEALRGLQKATDRLEAENVYLRQEVDRNHGFDEIIGHSQGVLRCLHMVEQVAATTTPVLILGETGTGKELIARAIHKHSDRRDRPLVKVNCAALPGTLIESELFGYEKGAFTGADSAKRGRFDLADGSTLFLDEIGDIPLELQPKLLRALQEGEIERLGGSQVVKVDVRIIVATNRNLANAVTDGEFRSDLFYRINTFPIEMPPLRERGDDIQLLAEHFVKTHSQNLGREVSAISAEMMRQLCEYSWPGNIRELDGVIQRALISSSTPVLQLANPLGKADVDFAGTGPRVIGTSIADLRLVERNHILAILDETNWKISGQSGAASKLGLPPSTLRSKMKSLSIVRPH